MKKLIAINVFIVLFMLTGCQKKTIDQTEDLDDLDYKIAQLKDEMNSLTIEVLDFKNDLYNFIDIKGKESSSVEDGSLKEQSNQKNNNGNFQFQMNNLYSDFNLLKETYTHFDLESEVNFNSQGSRILKLEENYKLVTSLLDDFIEKKEINNGQAKEISFINERLTRVESSFEKVAEKQDQIIKMMNGLIIEDESSYDDFVTYQLADGTLEILQYRGNEKVINVPEIIDGQYVTQIGFETFLNVGSEKIILPRTVQVIKGNLLMSSPSVRELQFLGELPKGESFGTLALGSSQFESDYFKITIDRKYESEIIKITKDYRRYKESNDYDAISNLYDMYGELISYLMLIEYY